MLFCSATMNRVSIDDTAMMLHPNSPYISHKDFPSDIGLNILTYKMPHSGALSSKFFTDIIWGPISHDGINVTIEHTLNW